MGAVSLYSAPMNFHDNAIRSIRTVCVFCGSSSGARHEYKDAAVELGRQLSSAGLQLVFGGGRVGLMGALADSVLSSGGQVIGVIPRALVDKEIAHTGLSELRVVESMHQRKALMADLADAFIMLPGGFGSWDEFCEIITWSQLGIHQKPAGVLNICGYYDALLAQAARAVEEGFVKAEHHKMLVVETDPKEILPRLSGAPVPALPKWIGESVR